VVGVGAAISGLGAGMEFRILSHMPSHSGEQVLVVPRAVFDEIGAFEGFRAGGLQSAVCRLLEPSVHFFMDRAVAEEDPTHKQIIPYCIFRCGENILHYTRGKSGGESRLHAKISVGVGGHVNPVDMDGGKTGAAAYHAAVAREIEEELVLEAPPSHRIIGMINDDSNSVGQVHLGIVHVVDLPSLEVSAREDALSDLRFSTIQELAGPLFDRLETWSQFCIRHLAGA
jgi:predicted NUDIX family phosphoesterase